MWATRRFCPRSCTRTSSWHETASSRPPVRACSSADRLSAVRSCKRSVRPRHCWWTSSAISPRPPSSVRCLARRRSGTEPPMRRMIRVGLSFVFHHDVIRPCVITATIVNFVCGGLLALTTVYLVRGLGASAGTVGLLVASEGAGTLVGAAITPRVSARYGSARAFRWAATIGAVMALLMPLATGTIGLVLFALGNAGFAGGVVVISILARTHRHKVVPRELLP